MWTGLKYVLIIDYSKIIDANLSLGIFYFSYAYFSRLAIKEVCLAQENFKQSGLVLCTSCYSCNSIIEKFTTSFFTTVQQRLLWTCFVHLCGASVTPQTAKEVLMEQINKKMMASHHRGWSSRTLWKERNLSLFEGESPPIPSSEPNASPYCWSKIKQCNNVKCSLILFAPWDRYTSCNSFCIL